MPSRSRKKYNKMKPLEHILHRPDTYVGSIRTREAEEFVSSHTNDFRISKKVIKYSPAILRIFVEPLSNALDNVARSKGTDTPCTKIKVKIDRETGLTTVWNDGEAIPVEIHEEENCYVHSMIFGQLLTSSNYNDEEERYNISGRNGMGATLCNIFSTFFQVKGYDPDTGKQFKQIWENNMKDVGKPKITSPKPRKGFTEVSWIPDFKRFKIKGYSQDIIDLYCKYVVDAAMLSGVNVFFNDDKIPMKSLSDYSKLYYKEDPNYSLHIKNKNAEIVVIPSPTINFQAISFASCVYTSSGGTHVDAWVNALLRPIVKKITKPKGPNFTMNDVKKYFNIFVVVNVVNPEFESQSKHKLESTVKASATSKHINALLRWPVIDDIKRSKEMVALKKIERGKKKFIKIQGLDPANNEGGPLSDQCTLILVEGLSAKTYAVQGIEVGAFNRTGRDFFGIYPLRGKLLNVRNAEISSIAKNNVISDIVKALGVRHNVDYTIDKNYKTLRYGRVMIITDADCDGIHISGLIQNMFHTLYPTLLQRKTSFITAMQTPIVKVMLNKKSKLFYDERQFEIYVKKYKEKYPNKKIDKKYYKGLGSSSSDDIMDTFGLKMIEFKNDEDASANMNKVFHKKFSDARKEWLQEYNPENIALVWNGDKEETVQLTTSDFLNTEMIKFSIDDCGRSIPHLMDGLKEGHRKVLFACFLKKLNYTGKSLKSAQLAGYVAEKTFYHHGEQNLYETITKMANAYPGSNNIPLLYRDGQFGTRVSGGHDSANARYTCTKLDMLTRLLFREEDDILLDRVVEDGNMAEPKFYVPILPVILINGCTAAIGTGWSSSLPSYNPLDLIESVKEWLDNDGEVLMEDEGVITSLLPELTPWYREHTGLIEKVDETKFISYGNITTEKRTKIVDELPIGYWTDNFKVFLDGLLEEKIIKKVKNYSTPKKVKFVITETSNGIKCNMKNLKLHKYLYTSNMVMFDENKRIKKFDSVYRIIDSFCKVRLLYYKKRKKHQLNNLKNVVKYMGNKRRFLEEVLNGDFKLFDDSGSRRKSRKTDDLFKDLEDRGYDKNTKDCDNNDSKDKGEKGYDYLLRLQFRSITEENIKKLDNDIDTKTKLKDKLEKTSVKKLWVNDLDDFQKAYEKFLRIMEKEKIKKKRK